MSTTAHRAVTDLAEVLGCDGARQLGKKQSGRVALTAQVVLPVPDLPSRMMEEGGFGTSVINSYSRGDSLKGNSTCRVDEAQQAKVGSTQPWLLRLHMITQPISPQVNSDALLLFNPTRVAWTQPPTCASLRPCSTAATSTLSRL